MYICEQLLAPDERRLRLTAQLGVQNVVIDTGEKGAWDAGRLRDYRAWVGGHGLKLDGLTLALGSVLLDSMTDLESARARRQLLADNIRKAADAGIECLKYDVQMSGVTRTASTPGRGGVENPGFVHAEHRLEAGQKVAGHRTTVSEVSAWNAIEFLLEGLLPAADAAGVRLACLPHDPAYPIGGLDGIEHVLGSPDGLRRFLALSPSRHHGLNFCQGGVAAMFKEPGKAMIPVIEEFAATGRIFLVRFRNIRGGYLAFQDVFPDEGDVDMFQAVKAYQRGGYAGPLCPDSTPLSGLDEGSERFSAFAVGYTRGLLQAAGAWSTIGQPAG